MMRCTECARSAARHGVYCSRVATYDRAKVLHEMVRVNAATSRARDRLEEFPNSRKANRALFLLNTEFWDWAWWLGFDVWESTREQRDAIRLEVDAARQSMMVKLVTGRRVA